MFRRCRYFVNSWGDSFGIYDGTTKFVIEIEDRDYDFWYKL